MNEPLRDRVVDLLVRLEGLGAMDIRECLESTLRQAEADLLAFCDAIDKAFPRVDEEPHGADYATRCARLELRARDQERAAGRQAPMDAVLPYGVHVCLRCAQIVDGELLSSAPPRHPECRGPCVSTRTRIDAEWLAEYLRECVAVWSAALRDMRREHDRYCNVRRPPTRQLCEAEARCDCGADEHNAKIVATLKALKGGNGG